MEQEPDALGTSKRITRWPDTLRKLPAARPLTPVRSVIVLPNPNSKAKTSSQAALTDESLAVAAKLLARRDRDFAGILREHGPPPLWARPAGFSTLVKIILEQQVSLASAASIFARLEKNTVPFRPTRMVELGEAHLKAMGLTRQKTAYCLHLAESLNDKSLRLKQLARMSDDEARAALMRIKGLGSWSADVYLLMVLRRPDVFPAGDLALITAITELKQLAARPTTDQLLNMAEAWRPYRAVAARMLWQFYLAKRKKPGAAR